MSIHIYNNMKHLPVSTFSLTTCMVDFWLQEHQWNQFNFCLYWSTVAFHHIQTSVHRKWHLWVEEWCCYCTVTHTGLELLNQGHMEKSTNHFLSYLYNLNRCKTAHIWLMIICPTWFITVKISLLLILARSVQASLHNIMNGLFEIWQSQMIFHWHGNTAQRDHSLF